MKKVMMIVSVVFLVINLGFAQEDRDKTTAYENILKKYVVGNQVNFTGLCQDSLLNQSVQSMSKIDPDQFTDASQKLSFWLNTYNVYTLKVICDKYPVKSMADLSNGPFLAAAIFGKTIWDKPLVVVNNKKYTLKDIDHQVIRGKFKDPRIQFSLYCGAESCPALRNEPYKGSELDRQMTEQAKAFFNTAQWNSFDLKAKKARLSPLLNWNAKYFGKDRAEILKFVAVYVPSEIADSFKNEPQVWNIQYTEYSMIINDAKTKRSFIKR